MMLCQYEACFDQGVCQILELLPRLVSVAASRLAPRLGRELLPFKADVRKLKRLGLTISRDVGYQLSPRGEAYLRRRGTT